MADVARAAGVSTGTVSNVLNNPGIVKEATRRRVLSAVQELGFVLNGAARSLAAGTANTVGFVAVDLANSYFMDIAKGIEEEAIEGAGAYKVLLANSDVDPGRQRSYIRYFEESRASGVILAPLDGPLDEVRSVRARGTAVVHVNWPGLDTEACGVVVDEVLGGELSAQHLIETGRRRLAFIGGPLSLTAVRDRLEGARRATSAAGIDLEVIETPRLTVRGGVAVGDELVRRPPASRPDGIVAAADALASGIAQTLLLARIRIPEDIALVGYDDNHFADSATVALSTVGQPGEEMGRLSMRLLREELLTPSDHVHRTMVVAPRLIVRSSSAAVSDESLF